MTAEAVPAMPSAQPSGNEMANARTAQDFARAARHARLVAILKLALPALCVGIVVAFAVTAMTSYTPNEVVPVKIADVRDGKLVMNEPKMAGFDKHNRPFDIRAFRAVQDVSEPDLITLDRIDAVLPLSDDSTAAIKAVGGTYNTKTQLLVLEGEIAVTGARGMDINLNGAKIDMQKGTLDSNKPVRVWSSTMDIKADAVQVGSNGDRVIFTGDVVINLQPRQKR